MTDPNTEPVLSAAGRPLPKRWLAIIATIWAGQAVSMVTSYAAGYAAVWYVTETTGSALALSLSAGAMAQSPSPPQRFRMDLMRTMV